MATKATNTPPASSPANAAAAANVSAPNSSAKAKAPPPVERAFTDVAASHKFSSTAAEHTFEIAKKPTIAGKPFNITYRRKRAKVPEEYTSNPEDSRIRRALDITSHWLGNNDVSRPIYNATNSFFGFGYDYVQISEEEELLIAEKMDKAWGKYKKKYKKEHGEKLKDDDILGIGLEMDLIDEKPNFEKDFCCYAILVQRDENNEIIRDKKGKIKDRLVYLYQGKPSQNSFLAAIATAVDLSSDPKRNLYKTFEAFLEARERGFEGPTKASSEKKSKEPIEVDKNICYLHAVLNFMKGLKSKEKQKKAFAKDKSEMDAAAMRLKEELGIEDSEQEDVEEVLRRHLQNCIEDTSRFAIKTSRERSRSSFYIFGSESTGDPEQSIAPIPFLTLTEKKDLQGLLDDHHLITDRKRLGTWRDKSQYSKPVYQLTKEHTQYTTKPPFLMLAIKRFKPTFDESTQKYLGREKIDDPIAVSDTLHLTPGVHITHAAAPSQVEYPIKGFIYHEGDPEDGAHIVTYMLDPAGSWRKFDDQDPNSYGEVVTKTDEGSEFSKRKQRAYVYLFKQDPPEKKS